MNRFKQVLKKLFFLPPLPTVLIALPSFTFVFWVLATGLEGASAYISYALSAYSMVITVTGITGIVRLVRGGIGSHPIVKNLLDHPLGGRYIRDASFRAELSLYPSLCVNLLYAALKMLSGILYGSVWFISLAAYYALLAVMRFLLLYAARKRPDGADICAEYRPYRTCGVLLVPMTLALAVMVTFLVRRDGGYDYPGVLIYVMAMYAFYAVITTAVNIVRFRRRGSPLLSAVKAVNLTAALASMLALETAMLTQFGGEDDYSFRRIMTASSGGVFCALVLAMAVYMIIHSTAQLRRRERSQ